MIGQLGLYVGWVDRFQFFGGWSVITGFDLLVSLRYVAVSGGTADVKRNLQGRCNGCRFYPGFQLGSGF